MRYALPREAPSSTAKAPKVYILNVTDTIFPASISSKLFLGFCQRATFLFFSFSVVSLVVRAIYLINLRLSPNSCDELSQFLSWGFLRTQDCLVVELSPAMRETLVWFPAKTVYWFQVISFDFYPRRSQEPSRPVTETLSQSWFTVDTMKYSST